MRNIFKLLGGVAFALTLAVSAQAGWSIVQKDDGSTVWQRTENGQETPVGRYFISTTLSNVATTTTSTAQTAVLTSPVTGNITAVFVQIDKGITQTLSFLVQSITTGQTQALIGSALTPATGFSISYANTTFIPTGYTSVGRNRPVFVGAISVPAGTASAAQAVITLQIDQ